MENYESIGFVISALVGAILTGVCVCFTGSFFASAICLICALLGGWIGKSVEKPKRKR